MNEHQDISHPIKRRIPPLFPDGVPYLVALGLRISRDQVIYTCILPDPSHSQHSTSFLCAKVLCFFYSVLWWDKLRGYVFHAPLQLFAFTPKGMDGHLGLTSFDELPIKTYLCSCWHGTRHLI